MYVDEVEEKIPTCRGCCCCGKGCKWCTIILLYLGSLQLTAVLFLVYGLSLVPFLSFITMLIGEYLNYLVGAAGGYCGLWCLIYSLQMCKSNNCTYLQNSKSDTSLIPYMEKLFYTPGYIVFYGVCYKYVNGKSSRKKNVSYTEKQIFKFSSWRDTSGLLDLDSFGITNDKPSVKLHLRKQIEICNDGTLAHYLFERDSFVFRLQFVDYCFKLYELNEIPGLDEQNLIHLGNDKPCFASIGCYVICFLLLCSECYKCCLKNSTTILDFTVRKLISKTQDLNKDSSTQEFLRFAPKIKSGGVEYAFHEVNKFNKEKPKVNEQKTKKEGPKTSTSNNPEETERNFQIEVPPNLEEYDRSSTKYGSTFFPNNSAPAPYDDPNAPSDQNGNINNNNNFSNMQMPPPDNSTVELHNADSVTKSKKKKTKKQEQGNNII